MIKNEISVNLINHKIKNFISSNSARLKLLFQKYFHMKIICETKKCLHSQQSCDV